MGEKKVIVRVWVNNINQHGPGRSYGKVFHQDDPARLLFQWAEECRQDSEKRLDAKPGTMEIGTLELSLED
jgi:hypothetical protein